MKKTKLITSLAMPLNPPLRPPFKLMRVVGNTLFYVISLTREDR